MRRIILFCLSAGILPICGFCQDDKGAVLSDGLPVIAYSDLTLGNESGPQKLPGLDLRSFTSRPAPMPCLKEKGDGKILVSSGLDLQDYVPVPIPNAVTVVPPRKFQKVSPGVIHLEPKKRPAPKG